MDCAPPRLFECEGKVVMELFVPKIFRIESTYESRIDYQLLITDIGGVKMAGRTGLEPATSYVTGRRSNQLNYRPAPSLSTKALN